MRRAWRSSCAAASAIAACGNAFATQQCPWFEGQPPTSPCATISQVVVFMILPALVTLAIVLAARRWPRRAWLRFAIIAVTLVTCVAWELLVMAVMQGFLAPCAASCWY